MVIGRLVVVLAAFHYSLMVEVYKPADSGINWPSYAAKPPSSPSNP